MAGETKNARLVGMKRHLRRDIPTGTDHIYRGSVSALGTVPGSVPPRPEPATPRRHLRRDAPTGTDHIYRAAESAPRRAGGAETLRRFADAVAPAAAAPGRVTSPHGSSAAHGIVRIMHPEDVARGIDCVVDQLNSGVQAVTVEVSSAEKALVRKARLMLATKVTREIITEDQARDVTFSAVAPAAPAEGPPPVGVPEVPAPVAREDDPAAFLGGEGVAATDDTLFGGPIAATATEAPAEETAAPKEEEEDDDAYDTIAARPVAEAVDAGEPAAEAPDAGEPAAEAEETQPAPHGRKGRRGGRGA
jgi:hypothetical protein